MKFLFVAAIAFILNMSFGLAKDGHSGTHTPNYCTEDKTVCAHLMFPKVPNSSEESQFITHFLVKGQMTLSEVDVVLWMDDMGHGSSPVHLETSDNIHFMVSQAYFIMPGQWQVKVRFKSNGSAQELVIPVLINE